MSEPTAKILVIDDEEAARYGIGKSLEREGYQIELASDGKEALHKIREFQPQTVISDINMPEMDGITLLREVSQLDDPPPVVLVTAYGCETLAIQALRAGAYDYISKPFNLEDLRLVVRNAIEKQRLKRELKKSETERILAERRAALGRLVAGFAHETNNPLGALSSAVQTCERIAGRMQTFLQERENKNPTQVHEHQRLCDVLSESSRVAVDACHRLASMVNTMRIFANLEHSSFRRVDIHECIESVLGLLKHRIKEGTRVFTEYGTVPQINCFPSDLNQVFMNLILNGIEAIANEGEIRIRTWQEAGMVVVSIHDSGRGIPPQDIDRIFEPGFTTKGGGVGTGMGLPISQKIIERHGGKIQAESEFGKGSIFTLQLPVSPQPTGEQSC